MWPAFPVGAFAAFVGAPSAGLRSTATALVSPASAGDTTPESADTKQKLRSWHSHLRIDTKRYPAASPAQAWPCSKNRPCFHKTLGAIVVRLKHAGDGESPISGSNVDALERR